MKTIPQPSVDPRSVWCDSSRCNAAFICTLKAECLCSLSTFIKKKK
uniref:Uncharacterized protein n=1 Tax=Anguilla anguilla TaxID=7936 RepID=A0A0E9RHY3_ANGAN